MKATGIVRRIDDLGRIVIPKEIRRTLRIREGDPMEIYTNREGEIMLKKYSPILELSEFAESYAESLSASTGHLVCITDRDSVIAAAGPKKKDYETRRISTQMEELIARRGTVVHDLSDHEWIKLTEDDGEEFTSEAIASIVCNGDPIGAVVIYAKDERKFSEEVEKHLVQVAAQFLGRQME